MKNPFSNLFKKKNKGGDQPAPPTSVEKKKKGFFDNFLKNRLGKQAAQGEEVVGVELTPEEIRLAQLSSNKSNQWVLEKFFVHKVEGLPEGGTVCAPSKNPFRAYRPHYCFVGVPLVSGQCENRILTETGAKIIGRKHLG